MIETNIPEVGERISALQNPIYGLSFGDLESFYEGLEDKGHNFYLSAFWADYREAENYQALQAALDRHYPNAVDKAQEVIGGLMAFYSRQERQETELALHRISLPPAGLGQELAVLINNLPPLLYLPVNPRVSQALARALFNNDREIVAAPGLGEKWQKELALIQSCYGLCQKITIVSSETELTTYQARKKNLGTLIENGRIVLSQYPSDECNPERLEALFDLIPERTVWRYFGDYKEIIADQAAANFTNFNNYFYLVLGIVNNLPERNENSIRAWINYYFGSGKKDRRITGMNNKINRVLAGWRLLGKEESTILRIPDSWHEGQASIFFSGGKRCELPELSMIMEKGGLKAVAALGKRFFTSTGIVSIRDIPPGLYQKSRAYFERDGRNYFVSMGELLKQAGLNPANQEHSRIAAELAKTMPVYWDMDKKYNRYYRYIPSQLVQKAIAILKSDVGIKAASEQ